MKTRMPARTTAAVECMKRLVLVEECNMAGAWLNLTHSLWRKTHSFEVKAYRRGSESLLLLTERLHATFERSVPHAVA